MPDNESPSEQLAPPSASEATSLNQSNTQSSAVKLDQLGPAIVNSDGTLSRIQNWASMTEAERQRTLKVLGKRNMLRQEKLKEEESQAATNEAV